MHTIFWQPLGKMPLPFQLPSPSGSNAYGCNEGESKMSLSCSSFSLFQLLLIYYQRGHVTRQELQAVAAIELEGSSASAPTPPVVRMLMVSFLCISVTTFMGCNNSRRSSELATNSHNNHTSSKTGEQSSEYLLPSLNDMSPRSHPLCCQ